MRPLVFHIPHASTVIPPDVRAEIALSDAALAREVLALTDHFTDDLFLAAALPKDAVVQFGYSRLVTDVERFPHDADEPMSQRGMGAVYTKSHVGQVMRPSLDGRETLMRRFYEPHHRALEAAVAKLVQQQGSALILDCHSFPELALPYEADQSLRRPEICIGTDAFHTPEAVALTVEQAFRAHGFEVLRNTPFSGSMVPASRYGRDKRVSSVMIELRRDLYMDEVTGMRKEETVKLEAAIAAAVAALRLIRLG